MQNLPERMVLTTDSIADPAAVVRGDKYRFTVLTSRLIRLEYSEAGSFEDRPTQVVLHRNLAVPEYQVIESEAELQIITKHLHLRYDKRPFSSVGLTIGQRSAPMVWGANWQYGVEPKLFAGLPTNLGGTARTLDGVDGPIPLEDGLAAIPGYALLDDAKSFALTDDGWVAHRAEQVDLYFFGYGHAFLDAVQDFYKIAGTQPLLPRYALGNWWSRYHRYTADSYLALMDRFEREHIPFSVAVIDMDWHLVDDVPAEHGSGWTGYTWNKNFFPDPAAFMADLHRRGMKVTLNVHPADGIRAFEEAYPRVAEAMGIDPASKLPVAFDLTDERFMKAYFELVHHPMEDEGVDFWWLDWQQGGVSKIPGLDPLWLLNHFHFLDSTRRGERPMTFSRYAGPGSHRYPIGFSGDTIITWESLDFQPFFTSSASNIGYGWWSHDIGGHMFGYKDNELETRWVQLGAFSPINRLHSTDNPFNGKEPWRFGQPGQQIQTEYLQLRHRLIPYLYTMNERAHNEGIPLVQPAYYERLNLEMLQVRNQFRFGSDIVVAPITSKLIQGIGLAKTKAWLPPGQWVDLTTGLTYDGDRFLDCYRGLEDYPVFAKAGTIIPTDGSGSLRADDNPAELELWLVPGADAEFVMYEDDGAADPSAAHTRFTWNQGEHELRIHPIEGDASVVPAQRSYRVRVFGDGVANPAGSGSELFTTVIGVGEVASITGVTVQLPIAALSDNDVQGRVFRLLDHAEIDFDLKGRALQAVTGQASPAARARALTALDLESDLASAVLEIVLAKI